ncbi:hypothetical protein V3W47_08700 [Deinococcus sp. YIM 134068]
MQFLVTAASNEDEARERFWDIFWRGEPMDHDHFGGGLKVQP